MLESFVGFFKTCTLGNGNVCLPFKKKKVWVYRVRGKKSKKKIHFVTFEKLKYDLQKRSVSLAPTESTRGVLQVPLGS